MSDTIKIIQEAYRLSEMRLENQFVAATAADQRALSIAGIVMAAAAILCALARDANVPIAMLIGAGILVVSAILAWFSAQPQRFFVPGAAFRDLSQDIEKAVDFEALLTQLGGFNDKHMKENDELMKRNSRLMRWAFWVAIFGLVAAILPQVGALNS